jgi:hypothetical protein
MIARSSLASPKLHTRYDFAPWTTALQVWLLLGSAALICLPELRGTDPWFGWLPFWLIVAPAIDLAVLRRRWLLDRGRYCLARVLQWRRSLRPQARPLRRRSPRVRHARPAMLPATASLQSVMPRRLRSMRRRNSPMMRR